MFEGKNFLVTGGTGSFGKAFIKTLLQESKAKRIVIFSRDELKQFEMNNHPDFANEPRLRFFLGDVRDKARLNRALSGIDTVVHAAALKQVPAAEYNPFEFVKTNVLGAQNVIEACLDNDVTRVVALSTDKAAAPINLYGATKLCSDKIFIAANNLRGSRDLRLSVVRYGNVMGSRGSVIPFFLDRRDRGPLPITDPNMTRFNITLAAGVQLVLDALHQAEGGEIFVPKIPSYRITDVAEAIAPKAGTEIVGIRPGEKIHEEMITTSDAPSTVEFKEHLVILPPSGAIDVDDYAKRLGGKRVPSDYAYNSGTNSEWLKVEELRTLIRDHVDSSFTYE